MKEPEGCALGFLVAGFLWVLIFTIAALLVNMLVK